MRRQGQGELLPFDLELERIANRLHREHREAQARNLVVMQNQEEQDHSQERNESQGGQKEIMVGIMPLDHSYSQMTLICCLRSLLYPLRLFSLLYEDHPHNRITSS